MNLKTNKLHNKSGNKRSKNTKDSNVTSEVYGLIIFALGVLLFLAILTYHQADPVFGTLVDGNKYDVKNFLGPIGATVAKPIFDYTFGYAALLFPLLMMTLGIFMMIDYPLQKMVKFSSLGLCWAFFFSVVMAMPDALQTGGYDKEFHPSGLIGGLAANVTARYLGNFALGFLSAIYLLILLMVTFQLRLSLLPLFLINLFQRLSVHLIDFLRKLSQTILLSLKKFYDWAQHIQWLPEKPDKSLAGSRFRRKRKPKPQDVPFYGRESASETPAENQEPVHNFSDFSDISAGETTEQETFPKENPDAESQNEFSTDYQGPDIPESLSPDDQAGLEEPGLSLQYSNNLEIEKKPELEDGDYDALVQEALAKYQMPSLELLHEDEADNKVSREELMANADLLENTLAQFNVKAFVKKVIEGPVITLYAVRPAEGVKINQVVSLADDLALAMRAKGIRMIAPIPGEAAIGIEIPNRRPSTVYFKSIVQSEKFKSHHGQLVLGMGKTIGGEVFCADLTRMPHLLIAGSTGSGKSVGINTIIASIIYRVPPSDVKFVMIDPKKLELTLYSKLKDHYLAFCPEIDEIVITHPQNAILILRSVINEMEERYDTLAQVGVRDIVSYNQKIQLYEEQGRKPAELRKLPYLVVIIDELADLILTASREVEDPITRLAQMARAVGIHLIVATQRPSVDILTGLIKANFPTRIAYQVATRPDSKVILDMYGAEKLIGNGDMLFLPPGTGKPVRLQNPFVSTDEVENMIKHVRRQPKFPPYELKLVRSRPEASSEATRKVNQDELFDQAKEIVIRHQQGSVSLLQRKLKIGYARAGRLMDELEEAGVVGPGQGSKARDVLISAYNDE